MFARWFRSKPAARDVTASPSPVISSKPLTLLTGFLGSGKTTHRCGAGGIISALSVSDGAFAAVVWADLCFWSDSAFVQH